MCKFTVQASMGLSETGICCEETWEALLGRQHLEAALQEAASLARTFFGSLSHQDAILSTHFLPACHQ
jgi:hypothetical protein